MTNIKKFFPFLRWFPFNTNTLRADVIAGITVALVLIPQSMAYAQLAGLPPYYGLYAAFLPPMVAVAFGSSHQLATGPVAIVSLLTAAALEPIAVAGSDAFVAYAVLLALMVGLFQVALGVLRMGVLVNFLSHPVVIGFTNAAAIIIATSQLGKLFGVSVEKAPHHYETVWNTLIAASETHWPTLALGVLAFTIILVLRRINRHIPNVLVAVALTTIISWAIAYENRREINPDQLVNETVRNLVNNQQEVSRKIISMEARVREAEQEWIKARGDFGDDDARTLSALHQVDRLKLNAEELKKARTANRKELQSLHFERVSGEDQASDRYYLKRHVPTELQTDGVIWRIIRISEEGKLLTNAGGAVVGEIPQGLPAFKLPRFDFDIFLQLLSSAIAISLIGFMEAISIAKAMAARTRQRLDANQELIGQGLANMMGSMFQSYPVSGSFSRSAVNIDAGAVTGFSSVVTGLVVVITLLFFTPLLYHLPQATLAAVIMVAVMGLVNVRVFKQIWQVQPQDGLVAVVTFVLTLLLAPHLDQAIIVGVILSLGMYLYHTMKPRVAVLARHSDGSLRDADVYGLQTCENISVIRFDGSLYFSNTSYFEDTVFGKLAKKSDLKYIIVDAEGINQLDATGEEMLANLTERLAATGVEILFARVKKQIMDVLIRARFIERFGDWRFFRRTEYALEYVWEKLGEEHKSTCPLHIASIEQK
ncbi:SulP family inorganic anion transporter [Kaarinaea lacus]